MKIEQRKWTAATGWQGGNFTARSAQLVLVFGATAVLKQRELISRIREGYPSARLLGCSTAGEICDVEVSDDSLVVTAITFEHTQLKCAHTNLSSFAKSFD